MKKKLNVVIIVIIILLVSGYFYLGKKSSPPNLLSSPTPTPIVKNEIPKNWKTYTSQKYNFEFKYPPEARLSDQSEGYVAVSFMGEKQKASGRTQTELFDGYAFNIADVTNEGYKNLDDFYTQKVIQLKEVCTKIGDPKKITISGKQAITHKLRCLNDYDSYYVLNNNTYFEISLFQVGEAGDLPAYSDTVNKIFSTFRFNN